MEKTIGERIKILRKQLKLNQTDFGDRLHVKQSTIGGWETNIRTVLDRSIADICREYKVNYEWLVYGEGEMFNEPDVMILEKIDDIMSGENEFRKNLVKTIVNFSDEELLLLESIVNKLNSEE